MRFFIYILVISSVVVVRFSPSRSRFMYFFQDCALWDLMLAGPTGFVLISSVSSESSVEISKDSGVVVLSSKNEDGLDEAIVPLDHSEDNDDEDEENTHFDLDSIVKVTNTSVAMRKSPVKSSFKVVPLLLVLSF